MDVAEFVLKALTLVAVVVGTVLAVRRFGLQRESATFLKVTVTTREVTRAESLALVALSVRLDNLGQTRIDARTLPKQSKTPYVYDDGQWDRFQHAGTLQVRPVARAEEALLRDWYSLPSMSVDALLSEGAASPADIRKERRDLEQINYLDDYGNPKSDRRVWDPHFWLEPKESYELVVILWLPPGTYAAKAVFVGEDQSPDNEEYWSHVCLFDIAGAHPRAHAST